jgi:hypothetical protein
MKAIVYSNCGSPDVLKCEEVEKPIPGDDEALIKVRAASAFRGKNAGRLLIRPIILFIGQRPIGLSDIGLSEC